MLYQFQKTLTKYKFIYLNLRLISRLMFQFLVMRQNTAVYVNIYQFKRTTMSVGNAKVQYLQQFTIVNDKLY